MYKLIMDPVERFSDLVRDLPDAGLEREWVWGSYKSEGIRFAYFRNYEDLRQLAVKIEQKRAEADRPISDAERILAGYHAAYVDLQALVSGVNNKYFEKAPAEGEWSIRRTYAHIVGADMGFYVAIKFALDRYRQGEDPLLEIDDETWLSIIGMEDEEVDSRMDERLPGLQAFHKELHARIINEFAGITNHELEVHAKFWEKETYNLRFRLGRFDAHMRQHTIQIEKTLQELGYVPGESQRLLRLIFVALAQVESGLIGSDEGLQELLGDAARQIDARTGEIEAILAT